ncbi:MAG: class I SAM-dependent methyltransferase [Caldilinea sp.]|nr:class I SAM-dependent methyltransferase [Caldilinea sp.]MDW8440503.1 class I SAM-dependent methyltransferase [Caldilineaceae bacterium]
MKLLAEEGTQCAGADARPLPSIDFAGAWRERLIADNPKGRLDPEIDRQFWASIADDYDRQIEASGSCKRTLEMIVRWLRPTDTLLDVGAGTGRFTLPLAARVASVTALDDSPDMLRVLAQKIKAQGVSNVKLLYGAMESTPLPPHDVVLAAWSLYRQLDLPATLRRLAASARRLLIIVAGHPYTPPHRPLMEKIWALPPKDAFPAYLYILGVMHQIGLCTEAFVAREMHCHRAKTIESLARRLAPAHASQEEIRCFAALLRPQLQRIGKDYAYVQVGLAGLIVHRREDAIDLDLE